MKPTITWVVIADGNRARVYEHLGPGKGLVEIRDLRVAQEPLKAGEIMADKPGRSFSSVGGPGARSSIEYSSDPVQVRERRFIGQLAQALDEKYAAGRFQRLVIAAAPTALGDIRPALGEAVRGIILGELPKDLTNVPVPKLGEHFDGLIAV